MKDEIVTQKENVTVKEADKQSTLSVDDRGRASSAKRCPYLHSRYRVRPSAWIVGVAGSGKTTLLNKIEDIYPSISMDLDHFGQHQGDLWIVAKPLFVYNIMAYNFVVGIFDNFEDMLSIKRPYLITRTKEQLQNTYIARYKAGEKELSAEENFLKQQAWQARFPLLDVDKLIKLVEDMKSRKNEKIKGDRFTYEDYLQFLNGAPDDSMPDLSLVHKELAMVNDISVPKVSNVNIEQSKRWVVVIEYSNTRVMILRYVGTKLVHIQNGPVRILEQQEEGFNQLSGLRMPVRDCVISLADVLLVLWDDEVEIVSDGETRKDVLAWLKVNYPGKKYLEPDFYQSISARPGPWPDIDWA